MAQTQAVEVLGIPHRIQGPRFNAYVEDPHFAQWLQSSFLRHVDCVFEEATGRSPSVAESLLKRRIPQPHYVDIDPTPEERRILGISEHSSGGAAIAPASSPDVYEYVTLDDQIKRETEWLRRISATKFEKALIICGLSHSLSIAFKLRSAGIAVREVYTYIPYSLLCPMRH